MVLILVNVPTCAGCARGVVAVVPLLNAVPLSCACRPAGPVKCCLFVTSALWPLEVEVKKRLNLTISLYFCISMSSVNIHLPIVGSQPDLAGSFAFDVVEVTNMLLK